MATLLLRLAGPLQSWGSDSKFDVRKTDYFPTKSGAIGLLAAALGRGREDDIADLCRLKFGVRVDHGGILIKDYQVTEMQSYTKTYNKNLSDRYYLSDATFLAGFESQDDAFLREIADALEHPAFPLFLGRRSCPPTLPLLLGMRDKSLYEALLDEPWLLFDASGHLPNWRRRQIRGVRRLRIVIDSNDPDAVLKKDLPLSFSMFRRQYTYRTFKDMPPKKIEIISPEHDPMKELEE